MENRYFLFTALMVTPIVAMANNDLSYTSMETSLGPDEGDELTT